MIRTITNALKKNMDSFAQRQVQAEQMVELLKRELITLGRLADEKQKQKEKQEIQNLQNDNKSLQKDILALKSKLQYYETQNGVKQVSVPARSKEQQNTNSVTTAASTTPAPTAQPPSQQPAKEKKEKKKKEPSANTGGKKGGDAQKKVAYVSRLCLKVGKIIEAKRHPDADGLLVETVDLAEEKPRTICSGIVKFYTPEQIMNRLAIFVCNLKPVKMRGISSEGMIMCAVTEDKSEIIEVPEGCVPGDRVICPNFPGEPDDMLNPKKKIFEQIQPDFRVDENGVATYKSSPFTVEGKGISRAPTITNGGIR